MQLWADAGKSTENALEDEIDGSNGHRGRRGPPIAIPERPRHILVRLEKREKIAFRRAIRAWRRGGGGAAAPGASVLEARALLGEGEQDHAGEWIEPAGSVEVLHHTLGIDDELVDDDGKDGARAKSR